MNYMLQHFTFGRTQLLHLGRIHSPKSTATSSFTKAAGAAPGPRTERSVLRSPHDVYAVTEHTDLLSPRTAAAPGCTRRHPAARLLQPPAARYTSRTNSLRERSKENNQTTIRHPTDRETEHPAEAQQGNSATTEAGLRDSECRPRGRSPVPPPLTSSRAQSRSRPRTEPPPEGSARSRTREHSGSRTSSAILPRRRQPPPRAPVTSAARGQVTRGGGERRLARGDKGWAVPELGGRCAVFLVPFELLGRAVNDN